MQKSHLCTILAVLPLFRASEISRFKDCRFSAANAHPNTKVADIPKKLKQLTDVKSEFEVDHFKIGICAPPTSGKHNKVAVFDTKVDDTKMEDVSFGNLDERVVINMEESGAKNVWFSLTYQTDVTCADKTKDNKTKMKRSSNVIFVCDEKMSRPEIALVSAAQSTEVCSPTFVLTSKETCKVYKKKWGFFSYLLLISILAMLAYCLGGCAYQRLVNGARGPEQLPNFHFWNGIYEAISSKISGSSYSRGGISSGDYRMAGGSQENQFHYDEPPLAAAATDNSTTTTAGALTNQQQQNLSAPTAESDDERLLPM